MATANNMLSPAQLAEVLGVSVETIYSWTSQKRVPYIKMGKLVRFSRNEINKWLGDKKIDVYQHGKTRNDSSSDASFIRMTFNALTIGGGL